MRRSPRQTSMHARKSMAQLSNWQSKSWMHCVQSCAERKRTSCGASRGGRCTRAAIAAASHASSRTSPRGAAQSSSSCSASLGGYVVRSQRFPCAARFQTRRGDGRGTSGRLFPSTRWPHRPPSWRRALIRRILGSRRQRSARNCPPVRWRSLKSLTSAYVPCATVDVSPRPAACWCSPPLVRRLQPVACYGWSCLDQEPHSGRCSSAMPPSHVAVPHGRHSTRPSHRRHGHVAALRCPRRCRPSHPIPTLPLPLRHCRHRPQRHCPRRRRHHRRRRCRRLACRRCGLLSPDS